MVDVYNALRVLAIKGVATVDNDSLDELYTVINGLGVEYIEDPIEGGYTNIILK